MFFRFILIAMSFGKFGEWLLLVNMRTTVLFHQLKFFRHLWCVRIFPKIFQSEKFKLTIAVTFDWNGK